MALVAGRVVAGAPAVTWVAIDDCLWADPRFIAISGDARTLYVTAFTWCGSHLTDGIVTDETVSTLARLYRFKNPEALVAELLACGLWVSAPAGPGVADYFPHNSTRVAVEAARKKNRERVAEWRRRNAVTQGPVMTLHASPPELKPGVQKQPRNAVTEGPVTDPPTPTPTPTFLKTPSEEGLDTEFIDRQYARRARANGRATEDEIRDLEAAALAEELAE